MRYDKWIRDWKTALAENFFLRSLTLLLGVGLILNATVFRQKERIIITPPQVSKQYWIEADRASPEYLEQMGVFFATLGGNLSPANAEYNTGILMPYISTSIHASVKADLSAQAQYIKKNNITQVFFPTTTKVNSDDNSVSVGGEVIRNIGTTRISKEEMVIHMKFALENYKLWLKEFYMDYPTRSSSEKKQEQKEQKKKDEKK